MKKEMLIPGTVLFFILVGTLAWFALDGNKVCAGALSVLGYIFLIGMFIVFPAFRLAAFCFPPEKIKGFKKRFIVFMTALAVFWALVYWIIWVKPEWGWKYSDFFKKYLYPLIEAFYENIR